MTQSVHRSELDVALVSENQRLKRELRRSRELTNNANAGARQMSTQLDRIGQALSDAAESWGRRASADPGDPYRAGRADQAAEHLNTFNAITEGIQ